MELPRHINDLLLAWIDANDKIIQTLYILPASFKDNSFPDQDGFYLYEIFGNVKRHYKNRSTLRLSIKLAKPLENNLLRRDLAIAKRKVKSGYEK